MAAVEDGFIERELLSGEAGSKLKFIFRALSPLTNLKNQPAGAIPLVGRSGSANIFFRFVGQTEEINFEFAIFDDGTDVSDGTHSSTVITVAQQIQYLRDNIYASEFDREWTLTQERYYPNGITGVITDIEFNNPAGAGTVVTGRLVFKPGTVGLV